jgi:hypothetical protein
MDSIQLRRSGPAAIRALQHGFVVSGEFHGQVKFAAVAQLDDVEGERVVVQVHVCEDMRIMPDDARFSAIARDDVKDDGAFQIASIISKRDGNAGLIVQPSFPDADPLPIVASLCREGTLE